MYWCRMSSVDLVMTMFECWILNTFFIIFVLTTYWSKVLFRPIRNLFWAVEIKKEEVNIQTSSKLADKLPKKLYYWCVNASFLNWNKIVQIKIEKDNYPTVYNFPFPGLKITTNSFVQHRTNLFYLCWEVRHHLWATK